MPDNKNASGKYHAAKKNSENNGRISKWSAGTDARWYNASGENAINKKALIIKIGQDHSSLNLICSFLRCNEVSNMKILA